MVYDDDKEWVPHYKKLKLSSGEARKRRETSNIRLAKIRSLEKIKELGREEYITQKLDEGKFGNNDYATIRNDLTFVDSINSGYKVDKNVSDFDKPILKLIRCDVKPGHGLNPPNPTRPQKSNTQLQGKDKKLSNIILNKFTSNYMIKGGKMVVKKTVMQFLQKGKSADRTKRHYRKRKRIKPRLNVTIPENKLFPKKKGFKFRSKIRKEQKSTLKNIETINKSHFNKTNVKLICKIKENTRKKKFQLSTCQVGDDILDSQLEVSNGISSTSLNTDHCSNPIIPDHSSKNITDVSLMLKEHFEAIEKILENITQRSKDKTLRKTKTNKSSEDKRETTFTEETTHKETNFTKDGPIPCYRIDKKEEPSGKLVLKFKLKSPSFNEDDERLNKADEITSVNPSKSLDDVNNTSDKVISLNPSKDPDIFAYFCSSNLSTDQVREKINKSLKKQNTILSTPAIDGQENDKSNKYLTSFDGTFYSYRSSLIENNLQKINIVRTDNEDPYEQRYEDLALFYNKVFDDTINEWCSEMGHVLEYIVVNENRLFDKSAVSEYKNFKSAFSEIGQERIRNLNCLFLKIYRKIFQVSENMKQRKILLIALFVKLKDSISKIANRPWTLKETRLNLMTYLTQDVLILPSVSEMFFKQEEAFLQDCMMVVDYTLKNSNSFEDGGNDKTASISVGNKNQVVLDVPVSGYDQNSCKPTPEIARSCVPVHFSSDIPKILENQVDVPNKTIIHKKDNEQQHYQRVPSENTEEEFAEDVSDSDGNVCQARKNYKLVQALHETLKNSSADNVEKIVEHLRFGDIDLNIASCKLKEIINGSDPQH